MTIKFNVSDFNAALKEYVDVCGKDMALELNKTASSIAYEAMKITPRMRNVWPVRKEDMPKRKPRATRVQRSARSTYSVIYSSTAYKDRLYFALAAKKGFKKARKGTTALLTAEARKIWGKRRRSGHYTAFAWAKSILTITGKPPKNKAARMGLHGDAAAARPSKATVATHRAVIENTASGAEKVGFAPMQSAMETVFADRIPHMRASIAKRALAASGRRSP